MAQQRKIDDQPEWARLNESQSAMSSPAVVNASIVLQNMTELSYPVPANTTLLRVLGPTLEVDDWNYSANCYAALDPPPSWWKPGNFPLSSSYKLQYAANRTMFLLPLDPTIKFTLRLGPQNPDSQCLVGGFRTYPFHL